MLVCRIFLKNKAPYAGLEKFFVDLLPCRASLLLRLAFFGCPKQFNCCPNKGSKRSERNMLVHHNCFGYSVQWQSLAFKTVRVPEKSIIAFGIQILIVLTDPSCQMCVNVTCSSEHILYQQEHNCIYQLWATLKRCDLSVQWFKAVTYGARSGMFCCAIYKFLLPKSSDRVPSGTRAPYFASPVTA